jgi:hypothetical protein
MQQVRADAQWSDTDPLLLYRIGVGALLGVPSYTSDVSHQQQQQQEQQEHTERVKYLRWTTTSCLGLRDTTISFIMVV